MNSLTIAEVLALCGLCLGAQLAVWIVAVTVYLMASER